MQNFNFLKKTFLFERQRGYIALISVLIISAVVLLIASSANLISISESDMSLQENQNWEVFYLAMACAEQGLMELKKDLDYTGNETLIFDNGTCTIESLEGTGNQNRVLKTWSTLYNQTRKIKIEIDEVNPKMEIKSWTNITDF